MELDEIINGLQTASEHICADERSIRMLPKCPDCSKLGVEMVETPIKWICPRCHYQIKKRNGKEADSGKR